MTAKAYDVGNVYAGFTQPTTHNGIPTRITATGAVIAAPGTIVGFYVANTTGGQLTLYDSPTTTANQVSGLITPAIGWNSWPGVFFNGLWVVVGGTIDVTFFITK